MPDEVLRDTVGTSRREHGGSGTRPAAGSSSGTVPDRLRRTIGVTEAPTLDTWVHPGANRWAFRHFSEVAPTAVISRVPEAERWVPRGLDAVFSVPRLFERIAATHTDALLIQRGDEVLAEWYAAGAGPEQPHLLMSVSKSLLAIVVGALIDDGLIDPLSLVGDCVPELVGSAFCDATVQQTLDMLVAVHFSEEYGDPDSDSEAHERAAGLRTAAPGEPTSVYEYLPTLKRSGTHGERFQYCSADTDVLAWVVENATGQRYSEVLSERLWSRLGSERDARISVDRGGFPAANGGIESTARDLARVGRLMLGRGEIGGRRVVSERWVAETLAGGDPAHALHASKREVFPNLSYRNQWWCSGDQRGSIHGAGIHGQYLWIDPQSDTVVVKFSSAPLASDLEQTRLNTALIRDLVVAVD